MQTQRISKEAFLFNVAFLQVDSALFDFNDLFDTIDAKRDGFIDEAEFKTIFNGIKGSWNSHQYAIMESILRDNDKF